MEKLKIEMYRFKNVLFGHVVDMAEELRETGTLAEIGDYSIRSISFPMLGGKTLTVRGGCDYYDNKAFCHNYTDENEARSAAETFKKLVDEINGVASTLPSEATRII